MTQAYAKLIDRQPQYAPNIVRYQESIVINPDAEKLTELGYKPVALTQPLGDAPEGYVWEETWMESAEAIVQGWEAVPEGELCPEEALRILLGGEDG